MKKALEQSLKAKVDQIAKTRNLPFNDVWDMLVMERFLARIAHSNFKADFIFKGGFLLAQYIDLNRKTQDLDFLIKNLKTDAKSIEAAFHNISMADLADGFEFKQVKSEVLSQEHMKFPGLRVSMLVYLGSMRSHLTIDIGYGDIVREKDFSFGVLGTKKGPIFEDAISLKVYPPESIFSEKLETIVFKGDLNSRMKDFHDIFLLIKSHLLEKNGLKKVIEQTFENRGTPLNKLPIHFNENSLETLNERWAAHLEALDEKGQFPEHISQVLDVINDFVLKIIK
ncbi:MAG: nucleotidyl transferase AbiEii/AbiGii toxin family protein [Deltaproteobacteria bacterium]|nr:nucleotidyl transferase AbiEii/AbiGii toxin family protein [Deltaproteobacteria bacterium]